LNISVRILLGYFVIVGVASWFVLTTFRDEVKPGVRQAMEVTLVDTAYVLAGVAAADMRAGNLDNGVLATALQTAADEPVAARVWNLEKTSVDYRVTITDVRGTVVYDSSGEDVGADHSLWRDVFLTLKGEYGARSTRSDLNDPASTVMHVAAPIRDRNKVVGVLTVAKPNRTVQPFVERSRRRILRAGLWLLGSSLAIGLLFALWITRSIRQLVHFAEAVSRGERVLPPDLSGTELAVLSSALSGMRDKLEGKQYIEQYVHALTHEMKSPLSAIRGAAELLGEDVPPAQRVRFAANVRQQSLRLQALVDRMLALASVESRQRLEKVADIDVAALADELVAERLVFCSSRGVEVRVVAGATGDGFAGGAVVEGDRFLLGQAIGNLIDNAIDFSPDGGAVQISLVALEGRLEIQIADDGEGVPDYAQSRVFERFFSLPRAHSGQKSTGLGLPFVREVAQLHGGGIDLCNAGPDASYTGAVATLRVAQRTGTRAR
jgi:two-component system, OmpR family, sensor histidine kinase CreC